MAADFDTLNREEMEEKVLRWHQASTKLSKSLTLSPPAAAVARVLVAQVGEFKKHVPLIMALRNPGLRARHWRKVSEVAGVEVKPGEFVCVSVRERHIESVCVRDRVCRLSLPTIQLSLVSCEDGVVLPEEYLTGNRRVLAGSLSRATDLRIALCSDSRAPIPTASRHPNLQPSSLTPTDVGLPELTPRSPRQVRASRWARCWVSSSTGCWWRSRRCRRWL